MCCTGASLLARSRPSRHDDCQDGHWMLPWWGVWSSLTAQPCCTLVGMGLICPLRDDPAGQDKILHLQRCRVQQTTAQTALGTDWRMHCQPILSHCDKLPSPQVLSKLLPQQPQQPQLLQGGWTMHGRLVSDGPCGSGLGRSQPSSTTWQQTVPQK